MGTNDDSFWWAPTAAAKYVIIGGKFKCAKTNQKKKLKPGQLMELYGLDISECKLYLDENRYRRAVHKGMFLHRDNPPLVLRCRRTGDYEEHLKRLKLQKLLEKP